MMGATIQGVAPGAAEHLLNLLDLIANPDRAKALAKEMRDSAAKLDKARGEAEAATVVSEKAAAEATDRIGAAVDAEKKLAATLEKQKAAEAAAATKAAATKAEIAADRRELKAECEAAALAAGDTRAQFAAEQARLDAIASDQAAIREVNIARSAELDERDSALKAAEADLTERLAKLKALAG